MEHYDLVYGIHPINHLLKAGRRKLYRLMVATPEPAAWKQLQKMVPAYCQVTMAPRHRLTTLAGTEDHQGFVGHAAPLPLQGKPYSPLNHPFVVLLDGIQDPRNVGAIIRSAYCTGVSAIILGDRRTAPLNAVVYKSSAGLIEHMPLRTTPTSTAAAQELVQAGYHLYCAALPGTDATQVAYQAPTALVIGNEGSGIVSSIRSLGASVTAGILLFHIGRHLKRI